MVGIIQNFGTKTENKRRMNGIRARSLPLILEVGSNSKQQPRIRWHFVNHQECKARKIRTAIENPEEKQRNLRTKKIPEAGDVKPKKNVGSIE